MSEILTTIGSYLAALTIMMVVNSFVVWVGLVISGVSTSLRGLFGIAAALTIPHLMLPWFIAGSVGAILFWIIALKVTSADGFGDIVILNGVTNIVSTWASFFIIIGGLNLLGPGSDEVEISESTEEYSVVEHDEEHSSDREPAMVASEEEVPHDPSKPRNAYAALRDELSPEERAAIDEVTAMKLVP